MSEDLDENTVCPVAHALEVAGDRWTLLILRELSLGVHRFDDLQAQLGMSSHLLSTRLKKMVEVDGSLERRRYSEAHRVVRAFSILFRGNRRCPHDGMTVGQMQARD